MKPHGHMRAHRRLSTAALVVLALSGCAAAGGRGGGVSTVPDDVSGRIAKLSPDDQLLYLRGLEQGGRRDAVVYFHMGNSFYTLEQLDSAIVYYGRSIGADSSFAKAWVNMGLAYDAQGQIDASRRAFEEALAVNPKDVLALCHLGFSHFTRGHADVAMGYYLEALSIDPGSAQAHYNLGLAFADAKLFGEALTEWRKVVALDPDGELGKAAAENVGLIQTYLELEE